VNSLGAETVLQADSLDNLLMLLAFSLTGLVVVGVRRSQGLTTFRSMTSSDDIPDYPVTSVGFEARYPGPSEEEMTDEQKEIRNAIVATRKRTGLSGPFGPWLAVPAIAQPAQALGRACRYRTSLSFKESELVILLTGAKTKSHAEFDIHVGEALRAGWSLDFIQAIPRDDDFSLEKVKSTLVPMLEGDERNKAIALFTAELVESYTVSDKTYEATKKVMNGKDSVLVEIVSISGYYTYVAYTLNVFRIPSATGTPPSKRKREEDDTE
jgi:4-carboxymuconolactone decarboxylase